MKIRMSLCCLLFCCTFFANAQEYIHDSTSVNGATYHYDARYNTLGQKMIEYNKGLAAKSTVASGYRLMVLNTTDRKLAMQTRANLLQKFPNQKVYTTFLAPYIKLKFGNFLTREEAETMKSTIDRLKLVSGNIYILSEQIEKKPTAQ